MIFTNWWETNFLHYIFIVSYSFSSFFIARIIIGLNFFINLKTFLCIKGIILTPYSLRNKIEKCFTNKFYNFFFPNNAFCFCLTISLWYAFGRGCISWYSHRHQFEFRPHCLQLLEEGICVFSTFFFFFFLVLLNFFMNWVSNVD